MTIYPRDFTTADGLAVRPLSATPSAFALMPFKPRREFEEVFNALKRGFRLSRPKLNLKNAGEPTRASPITQDILEGIRSADLVVADMTGRNANVFYELGVAHVLHPNRHVMLITRSMRDVPFDLRVFRIFPYRLRDLRSLERLVVDFVADLVDTQRRQEATLTEAVMAHCTEWMRRGRFPESWTFRDTLQRYHDLFKERRHDRQVLLFLLAASIHYGYAFNYWARHLRRDKEAIQQTAAMLAQPGRRTAWRAAWCLQQMDERLSRQAVLAIRRDVESQHRGLVEAVRNRLVDGYVSRLAHARDNESRRIAGEVLSQFDTLPGG